MDWEIKMLGVFFVLLFGYFVYLFLCLQQGSWWEHKRKQTAMNLASEMYALETEMLEMVIGMPAGSSTWTICFRVPARTYRS